MKENWKGKKNKRISQKRDNFSKDYEEKVKKRKKSQRKGKASQPKVIGWINLGFKTKRIKIFHKPKVDRRQWLNLRSEQWKMGGPFKVPLRPLCFEDIKQKVWGEMARARVMMEVSRKDCFMT